MKLRRAAGPALCIWVLIMAMAAGLAGAAESDDLKTVEQKATTAFALGRFAEAGETFEKAYELKPDAALLYNAAQSYRLAGNKERALSLYENYQRVYGKREKREEVEKRISELKQAIEHDKAVSTSPPTGTEPVSAAAAASGPPPADKSTSKVPVGLPAARDPEASSSHPLLVSKAEQPHDDGSVVKKAWFWVVVGGGVAAAAVVVLLLASGGAKDPSPSMGKVNGN